MAVPVTDMIVSTAEDGVVAETTAIHDPSLAMAQSDVNNVLLEIISRFSGATYAGVATPETDPGTPLLKVFYLTTTAGEYTNFSNLTAEPGKLTVLLYNGSTWEKQVLDLPASGGGSTVNVVQATGTSTTDVMSQKAVTDELVKRQMAPATAGKVGQVLTQTGPNAEDVSWKTPSGGGGTSGAVLYVSQSLSDEQKLQARANINAQGVTDDSLETGDKSVVGAINEVNSAFDLTETIYGYNRYDTLEEESSSGESSVYVPIEGMSNVMVSIKGSAATYLNAAFCYNRHKLPLERAAKGERVYSPKMTRSGCLMTVPDQTAYIRISLGSWSPTISPDTLMVEDAAVPADEFVAYVKPKTVKPLKELVDYLSKDEAEGIYVKKGSAFVSPSGSDGNDGLSPDTPKATVNACLKQGFSTIFCGSGTYSELIDLSFLQSSRLELIKYGTGRAIFSAVANNVIISDGSETIVEGKSKVYQIALSSNPYNGLEFSGRNTPWLFQENIDDVNTLIPSDERHPAQRGRKYRLDCTKIEYCNATDLSSAVDEIESADVYKWYYDAASQKMYFSRPAQTSAENRIFHVRGGYDLFTNNSPERQIVMQGIETRLRAINLSNLASATLIDCAAKYTFMAGAIYWDNCPNVELIRCEAAANSLSGSTGDGVNGHMQSQFVGDDSARVCCSRLEACWCHDNNDDGVSMHEYAETFVLGGLYEHNGKAGVTPSTGQHCECHNVWSQRNYNGFEYVNPATDGGEGGDAILYGCVSYKNDGTTSNRGFYVTGLGNSMKLVNCKAIGQKTGFSGDMTLIDCSAAGCETMKDGSVVIQNTSIIE